HMVANDFDWVAPWAHHVFIGSAMVPVLFVAAVALAVSLDWWTLRAVAQADHLLKPAGRALLAGWFRPGGKDGARLAGLRYLRTRNGIHYRRAADRNPWPADRSATGAELLAGMARLGR